MFSRAQLAECVHAMLRDCGAVSADRLADFSLHSFRIYLACALLDRGYSEAAIMAALRWKTCEALKIYARMGDAGYADMIDEAATATVTSTQAPNIPDIDGAREGSKRGPPQHRRSTQQPAEPTWATVSYSTTSLMTTVNQDVGSDTGRPD